MAKTVRMAATFLALGILAGTAEAETTADEVTDRESLMAFVEGAKAEIEAITDINVGATLRDRLRTDPKWKSGSMFLIIFLRSGEPFIHGNDRTAESKNLIDVEDDHGKRVVEELLAAAAGGGGFVEYHDGEPKTAYAVEYTSGITGRRFVLVGGYSQDVSHVPIQVADHLPTPAVTASQVVDRETLITFVEEAARVYREAVQSEGYSAITGIRSAFRVEGGDWKSGSVYLWVVSGGGVTLFHGTEPFREGKPTDMTRTDINGVRFAEELIGGARREGRKFLRYHYDDPTIEGDEDTGSPKLGYAVSFTVANSPQKAVIGSGIYISDDGGEPEAATRDQNAVVESALPQVMRAMTASTVDAVSGRIQRATSNTPPAAEFSFGGASTLSDALLSHGHALGNDTLDFTRLLAGSSFTMTLNAADNGGGGPFGNLTLWGSGDYRSIVGGDPRSVDYDGSVTSANLGVDTRLGADMLAGVALTQTRGTVDYTASNAQTGELTTSLTSVNPYVGWQMQGGMNLWAMAGFGSGEVEIDDGSSGTLGSDLTQRQLAAGVNGPLVSSDELIGGGTTNLNLKGEVAFTSADIDGSGALSSASLSASRQRLMLEGEHVQRLASGATFTPSLELGVRNDGGDGETGSSIEAGGALRYADAASGLTVEGRVRTLLSHSGNYEETGVSGLVRLDPGASGRGLALSVQPAWGRTASGVNQLWENGIAAGVSSANLADGRMNARISYGIGAGQGVLTPYTGVSLSEDGSRHLSLGGRFDIGPSLRIGLEGIQSRSIRGSNDHSVMLRGSLN